jgi:hypothetical protein
VKQKICPICKKEVLLDAFAKVEQNGKDGEVEILEQINNPELMKGDLGM